MLSPGTRSEVAGRQQWGPSLGCTGMHAQHPFEEQQFRVWTWESSSILGEGLWKLCPCSAVRMPVRELRDPILPSLYPLTTETYDFRKPL